MKNYTLLKDNPRTCKIHDNLILTDAYICTARRKVFFLDCTYLEFNQPRCLCTVLTKQQLYNTGCRLNWVDGVFSDCSRTPNSFSLASLGSRERMTGSSPKSPMRLTQAVLQCLSWGKICLRVCIGGISESLQRSLKRPVSSLDGLFFLFLSWK